MVMNINAKFWSVALTTLVATTGLWGFSHSRAGGVQFADGTIHFVQVPRLVKASTTVSSARAWGATYYFTIDLPAGAGEPLHKLVLHQKEGADEIAFRLDESEAFQGDRSNPGSPFQLAATTSDGDGTLSVIFDPPIAPGQRVTLSLRPVHNPVFSGVYLIGVTAFPAGEKAQGYSMGYGRLHFYDDRRFFPFW